MDSDFFWHSVGGGAIIAAALTLARLLLEYGLRGGERRLERCDLELHAERVRSASLEQELLRVQQAYDLLKAQLALRACEEAQRLPR